MPQRRKLVHSEGKRQPDPSAPALHRLKPADEILLEPVEVGDLLRLSSCSESSLALIAGYEPPSVVENVDGEPAVVPAAVTGRGL